MNLRAATFLSLLFLAACNEEENHTIEYFLENEHERATMIEACEVQDRSGVDANCRNATEAAAKARRIKRLETAKRLYGE